MILATNTRAQVEVVKNKLNVMWSSKSGILLNFITELES
jgi:hypothetical protein